MSIDDRWDEIPNYDIGDIPEKIVNDEGTFLFNLIVVKRALRSGYEWADEDPETTITDILVDLRHLCDALGVDFVAVDASANTHYVRETCAPFV